MAKSYKTPLSVMTQPLQVPFTSYKYETQDSKIQQAEVCHEFNL